MPYPLPSGSDPTNGRVRILPPVGCPGGEEWVLVHEAPRWLELSFRLGPVPALPLDEVRRFVDATRPIFASVKP